MSVLPLWLTLKNLLPGFGILMATCVAQSTWISHLCCLSICTSKIILFKPPVRGHRENQCTVIVSTLHTASVSYDYNLQRYKNEGRKPGVPEKIENLKTKISNNQVSNIGPDTE